ncbi:MAG: methyltransferase domain-containing protein [Kangiellaceae bacterium]|nr:methyltransferase domain-containing protein [Kangiellaceae bacterium]
MPEVVELPEDNLFNVFNIILLENKHRLVKQLKKCYQPNVHGDKTWFSSYLIMDYLQTHNILKRNSQVLELGCGWGATSVYCAKNGAKRVVGLDIDDNVFPYLDVHATLNDVKVETINKSYEKLTANYLADFNLLLGADICFWEELTPMIGKMIRRAFKSGKKRVIVADPGRQPFLDLAEYCKPFAKVDMSEWYVCDPEYYDGYILDLQPR